jgi:ABC-type Co2+ transport system permease subunit
VTCVASGLIFTLLGSGAAPWESAMGSLVMGAGLGLLSTPIVVGLQSVVGWDRRGTVTGANMFTRQLGQALGAAVFGSIANATLIGYFHDAPARLAGRLPANVNAASKSLAGGSTGDPAVTSYVQHGLYLATHHVFVGLIAVAVAAALVLLLAPRRFPRLFDTAE